MRQSVICSRASFTASVTWQFPLTKRALVKKIMLIWMKIFLVSSTNVYGEVYLTNNFYACEQILSHRICNKETKYGDGVRKFCTKSNQFEQSILDKEIVVCWLLTSVKLICPGNFYRQPKFCIDKQSLSHTLFIWQIICSVGMKLSGKLSLP